MACPSIASISLVQSPFLSILSISPTRQSCPSASSVSLVCQPRLSILSPCLTRPFYPLIFSDQTARSHCPSDLSSSLAHSLVRFVIHNFYPFNSNISVFLFVNLLPQSCMPSLPIYPSTYMSVFLFVCRLPMIERSR